MDIRASTYCFDIFEILFMYSIYDYILICNPCFKHSANPTLYLSLLIFSVVVFNCTFAPKKKDTNSSTFLAFYIILSESTVLSL